MCMMTSIKTLLFIVSVSLGSPFLWAKDLVSHTITDPSYSLSQVEDSISEIQVNLISMDIYRNRYVIHYEDYCEGKEALNYQCNNQGQPVITLSPTDVYTCTRQKPSISSFEVTKKSLKESLPEPCKISQKVTIQEIKKRPSKKRNNTSDNFRYGPTITGVPGKTVDLEFPTRNFIQSEHRRRQINGRGNQQSTAEQRGQLR